MVFNNNLLLGASTGGYEIEQSIRFNSGDSATMSRSFGTPTDQNKFTWSFWAKSTKQQNGTSLGINVTGGVTFASMIFNGGSMQFFDYTSGSANIDVRTTFTSANGKFRDYTAWYHVMFVYDSDQGTDTNRLKFFVNGTQFPSGSLVGPSGGSPIFPGSGANSKFNASGTTHLISDLVNGKLDGYFAEMHFIDGQALDPTSFGEFDSTSGQFVPIQYTGTFGNNGFLIQGEDSSDLGNDSSGNNNDFTTSGLATNDQVTDTPTNNTTFFNLLGSCNVSGQPLTLSDGNLRCSASGTSNAIEAVGTIAPTTGKYYAEFTLNAAPQLSNQYPAIGIIGIDLNITGGNNLNDASFFGYLPSGNKLSGGSSSSYGDTFTTSDIIGIALDLDNQKIYFSKNGTYQNSGDPVAGTNAAFTNLVAGTEYRFCISHAGSSATDVTMNAGQSAFNTAAPTGYLPMSAANLDNTTIADPSAYFQTSLWNGNGSTQTITQSGNSTFEPGWIWSKARNAAQENVIFDQVRGTTKYIQTDNAGAEGTQSGVTAFNSDGFDLGSWAVSNGSGQTHVGWQWKANGSGSSNNDGSVTSTVSNESTANFSIVKYTGTGSGNSTVGHGLGVTPDIIICKHLDRSQNWRVFHTAEGVGETGFLNTTDAFAADPDRISAVSSTTFTAAANMNESADYIAYCFADVEGYSKINGYSGNGSSDGPYIHLGFKPAFLFFKCASAVDAWQIYDNRRRTYNGYGESIAPNSSAAEGSFTERVDLLSNGFKIRSSNTAINGSGQSYVYMAFAHTPFKTATAFGIEA